MQAPLDDLKARVKRIRVGAVPDPELSKRLAALPSVAEVEPSPGGYLVTTTEMSEGVLASLRILPGIEKMQVVDLNLEEVFLAYCVGRV